MSAEIYIYGDRSDAFAACDAYEERFGTPGIDAPLYPIADGYEEEHIGLIAPVEVVIWLLDSIPGAWGGTIDCELDEEVAVCEAAGYRATACRPNDKDAREEYEEWLASPAYAALMETLLTHNV